MLSIERDWKWVLAAKRFAWQAAGGRSNAALREKGGTPVGSRVSVHWGDALKLLPKLQLPVATGADSHSGDEGCIDMLFLDGTPKEALGYLQAAEPRLADGATIVADNAGAVPAHR